MGCGSSPLAENARKAGYLSILAIDFCESHQSDEVAVSLETFGECLTTLDSADVEIKPGKVIKMYGHIVVKSKSFENSARMKK